MNNPLEHAEHIAHAGHQHEEGHGPQPDHEAHSKLGTYIGITMAVLGVLLAYCAAKVGAERTELVQALVEQQNAHAKYQAQDIKHRVAVSDLRQMHAEIPAAELGEHLDDDLKKIDDAEPKAAELPAATTRAARALGRSLVEALTPNKADVVTLADTVERYYRESQAASVWVDSFNPAIQAHVEAQERFEQAQLLAEIGIVVASVALLIKRRAPWFAALALGVASVACVIATYAATGHVVREAEAKIEETGKEYREMRNRDKMTESDDALVAELRTWGGKSAAAAPEHHAPTKEGHHD
jgi:hypothetical protein